MDKIMDLFEKFVDFLDKDLKPRKVIISVIIIVLALFIFLFVYNHYSFEKRTEKRINNLQKLTELSSEINISSTELQLEFENILEDINKHYNGIEVFKFEKVILKDTPEIKLWKFISGAFWSILILFLCPFIYKTLKETLFGVTLFTIIGIASGVIGLLIPTIINPKINYFGFPILQLVIVILIVIKTSKKNENIKSVKVES